MREEKNSMGLIEYLKAVKGVSQLTFNKLGSLTIEEEKENLKSGYTSASMVKQACSMLNKSEVFKTKIIVFGASNYALLDTLKRNADKAVKRLTDKKIDPVFGSQKKEMKTGIDLD